MAQVQIDHQYNQIWLNGDWVPWDEAKIHILSHGLNNASCIFEGIRVYSGKIFRLKEHLQRFINSAVELDFKLSFTLEELIAANQELVDSQNISDGYLRPIAWLGSEALGISAVDNTVNVAIAAIPWLKTTMAKFHTSGMSLAISSWVRPAPNMAPVNAKTSCHYVVGRLSCEEAKRQGYDDALLLDYRGYLAESTGANLFIVTNGTLVTPIPDCFLNGITRQTVITIAKENGIEVIVKHIHPSELTAATEAFLTGTAIEIMPVRKIGSMELTAPGAITRLISEAYQKLVYA